MKKHIPADTNHGAGHSALPAPEQLPLEIYMGILDIKEKLNFQTKLPAYGKGLMALASQVQFLFPDIARLIHRDLSSLEPDELDGVE